ncbi:MAG: metallophosphoesterase family protein [Desulfobacca sp.]|uniref:metallophosphoesterase family protein n=1 Tax=Desulfobacca sp. TaxID=2067990 RepID=UPI004049AF62
MQRVAILSDIHGNLPALEAVLADIRSQGIKEIYHLGDLVGYNPFPNEAVALVAAQEIPGITGNYDQAVLALVSDPIGELLNAKITPMGKEIYAWTVQAVTPQTRAFLLAQPRERSLAIGKWRLRLTHGSPRHIRDYVRPSWPEEMVAALLAEVAEDILLTGHTHIPVIRPVQGKWLLTPGSVGFPNDGNPLASYMILELGETVMPTIRRVPYDLERTIAAIRQHGLPDKAGEDLRLGRR